MLRARIKSFYIYDEIYKASIWVIVCKDKDGAISYMKKKYNLNLPKGRMGEGCTWTIEYDGCVIWMPKFTRTAKWLSVLNHELFHVISFILRDRAKIPLSKKSEEAYCYYFEAMSKQIIEELLKSYSINKTRNK